MISWFANNRFPYLPRLTGTAFAALFVSSCFGSAVMANGTAPVPTVTIYPGDSITSQVLRDQLFTDRFMALGGYFHDYDRLIGKVARRTLIRGKPIPLSSVRHPFAVRNGQVISLQYKSGPLLIVTKAISLKSAVAGEYIQTRNIDTGRTIAGLVQADGSVLVMGK